MINMNRTEGIDFKEKYRNLPVLTDEAAFKVIVCNFAAILFDVSIEIELQRTAHWGLFRYLDRVSGLMASH